LKLSESKDLGNIGMNDMIPQKTMFLVPPLPLIEEPKDKDDKGKATGLIKFILKQRAGSTSSTPIYKLKFRGFAFEVLLRDCIGMNLLQEGHCGALATKRLK
jgi:hypothetical protein